MAEFEIVEWPKSTGGRREGPFSEFCSAVALAEGRTLRMALPEGMGREVAQGRIRKGMAVRGWYAQTTVKDGYIYARANGRRA